MEGENWSYVGLCIWHEYEFGHMKLDALWGRNWLETSRMDWIEQLWRGLVYKCLLDVDQPSVVNS